MLYTYNDIKREITDNWELLELATYPEDTLAEWADSAVPIYTSEIVNEWTDMPYEYRDRWSEITDSPESITHLMGLDLYFYYREQYSVIYAEILESKEEEE